jgi:hypothetical protein
MVFVPRQSQLRIPVGGLVIGLNGEMSVSVELGRDIWPVWLDIAVDKTATAEAAHSELLAAIEAKDNDQIANALDTESQSSMVAVAASAFALDAFYAAVKGHIPELPEQQASWKASGAPRATYISETLIRGFRLSSQGKRMVRTDVKKLFQFRGWAVHPHAGFRPPLHHPDLGTGVDWWYATYTAKLAHEATHMAVSLVGQCMRQPKPIHAELVEWAPAGNGQLQPILDAWEERYGASPLPRD